MNEKYSFGSAESEANNLQDRVESGAAGSYAQAEEQLESENFISSPERLIPEFDMRGLQSPKLGLYIAEGKTQSYDFNTVFSDFAINTIEHASTERLQALKAGVEGRVLIDIGAGDNTNGYIVAQMLGAKGYVALEPHNFKHLYTVLSSPQEEDFRWTEKSPKKRTIPFCVVAEGVETFLKRVPDNSVAVMASAVDELVLSNFTRKQIQEISADISRVVARGGSYINFLSYLQPEGLKKSRESMFFVYTKEL